MAERLQKIISSAGLSSRRAAEKLILEGRVTVNGKTASLGDSADPELDNITVDGVAVRPKADKTYIMLNKPKGYVTTLSDEKGRRTVAQLISDVGTRLYPVGRLDMYSEGLLIMTDDGDAAFALTHPSHNIEKTYHVSIQSPNIFSAIELLRKIRDVDGEPVHPARVELIQEYSDGALISVTIHEGRNRQVRRMCAKAEMKVTRLVRISEGKLCLGNLRPGKWRFLTQQEINYLHQTLEYNSN